MEASDAGRLNICLPALFDFSTYSYLVKAICHFGVFISDDDRKNILYRVVILN